MIWFWNRAHIHGAKKHIEKDTHSLTYIVTCTQTQIYGTAYKTIRCDSLDDGSIKFIYMYNEYDEKCAFFPYFTASFQITIASKQFNCTSTSCNVISVSDPVLNAHHPKKKKKRRIIECIWPNIKCRSKCFISSFFLWIYVFLFLFFSLSTIFLSRFSESVRFKIQWFSVLFIQIVFKGAKVALFLSLCQFPFYYKLWSVFENMNQLIAKVHSCRLF